MYNRYIRNDRGSYTRVPEEPERPQKPPKNGPGTPPPPPPPKADPSRSGHPHPEGNGGTSGGPPPGGFEPGGPGAWDTGGPSSQQDTGDIISRLLRHLLDRFHLESVDTGDLLLLILLFLLYEEKADEEVLFALGLLLIL